MAQLAPPSDDKIFEKIVRDVCRIRYDEPLFELYGRRGQKQDGIDGYHLIGSKVLAFQCKQKDVISNRDSILEKILKDEMEEEASKAKAFFESRSLDVQTYIFASTFKNSAHLQNHAVELSKILDFPIEYWGWESISEDINKSSTLLKTYYSEFILCDAGKGAGLEEVKERALCAALKVLKSRKGWLQLADYLLELKIVRVGDDERGSAEIMTHGNICKELAIMRFLSLFEAMVHYGRWGHNGPFSFKLHFLQHLVKTHPIKAVHNGPKEYLSCDLSFS